MRQLTLKELQQLSLEILKDVADFCEKNGIRYSLGYGTLLGAVRHKGFIPWDDDVDLMMLREDYEKFRTIYKSDKYTFFDSRNTPDCYIAFGRVCDTERTLAASSIPWVRKDVGVWIDIFPIDRVPDDIETFRRLYDSLYLLMKFNLGIRRVHTISSSRFPLRRRIKIKDYLAKYKNYEYIDRNFKVGTLVRYRVLPGQMKNRQSKGFLSQYAGIIRERIGNSFKVQLKTKEDIKEDNKAKGNSHFSGEEVILPVRDLVPYENTEKRGNSKYNLEDLFNFEGFSGAHCTPLSSQPWSAQQCPF